MRVRSHLGKDGSAIALLGEDESAIAFWEKMEVRSLFGERWSAIAFWGRWSAIAFWGKVEVRSLLDQSSFRVRAIADGFFEKI